MKAKGKCTEVMSEVLGAGRGEQAGEVTRPAMAADARGARMQRRRGCTSASALDCVTLTQDTHLKTPIITDTRTTQDSKESIVERFEPLRLRLRLLRGC